MNKLKPITAIVLLTVFFAMNGQYTFAQSSQTPESLTVEKIMEQAVRNLTMRYNLNKDQTKKTQEIMTRRVQGFLRTHENKVWPVIRDLLRHQLGAKPPEDQDEAMRIGKTALPLVELAKEAILQGNKEWRQFLTPDQQRMHDFDLAEMDRSFQQIDRNFQQWAEGKPSKQLFPQPDPNNSGTPPRPRKPRAGLPKSKPVMFDPFRIFSVYVEDFIREYGLSEGQIDTARSILKEFRAKAIDFKLKNRKDLEEIDEDYAEAQEKGDRKKLVQVEAKRKVVLKPIYRLFSQMVRRLKAQLTSSQLQRFDAADQPAQKKDIQVPSKSSVIEPVKIEQQPNPQQPPAGDENN